MSTESTSPDSDVLDLKIVTCGLKDGLPEVPASTVVLRDLRTRLRNPPLEHPELYDMTGLDEPVRSRVFDSPEADRIVAETVDSIVDVLRGWAMRGRGGRIVGLIGCQYGRHRSVAIGEAVQARLVELGYKCAIEHLGLKELEPAVLGG